MVRSERIACYGRIPELTYTGVKLRLENVEGGSTGYPQTSLQDLSERAVGHYYLTLLRLLTFAIFSFLRAHALEYPRTNWIHILPSDARELSPRFSRSVRSNHVIFPRVERRHGLGRAISRAITTMTIGTRWQVVSTRCTNRARQASGLSIPVAELETPVLAKEAVVTSTSIN